MKRERFCIGDKYRVAFGSGLSSNKIVTIIKPFDWTEATDGTYKAPNLNKQSPVLYEDSTLGFMFKDRLYKI
jgi:hypothetical protein